MQPRFDYEFLEDLDSEVPPHPAFCQTATSAPLACPYPPIAASADASHRGEEASDAED